ncbi:TPA: hypothetical protein N0F65_012124 [Lagenidium giganteum]|uniref:Uncharacterized protein n=1 Tax=Lagenidium giganteum TaxID=4803 RepID=A0AAV2YJP2_9STRA|nr:TPA: hypothetical protein N0F65_012124 [Lagenidium giganteum]
MATAFAARFQRQRRTNTPKERVGEILSDNSDVSSVDGDGDDRQAVVQPRKLTSGDGEQQQPEAQLSGDKDRAKASAKEKAVGGVLRKSSPQQLRGHGAQVTARSASRKSTSRKWYSDSDEDELEETQDALEETKSPGPPQDNKAKAAVPLKKQSSDEPEESDDDSDAAAPQKGSKIKRLPIASPESIKTVQLTSPSNPSTPGAATELGAKKKTGFQKLVAKTRTLSPFGSKKKGFDVPSPASSTPTTPDMNRQQPSLPTPAQNALPRAVTSPMSDVASLVQNERTDSNSRVRSRRQSQDTEGRPTPSSDVISPASVASSRRESVSAASATSSAAAGAETNMIVNRRTSRIKNSGTNSEAAVGVRTLTSVGENTASSRRGTEVFSPNLSDALSPGQRKVPGAFPGKPGSGVLLEGWLRQKQRRGMKGMKKWNSRYFVLYGKSNEVRYYADVVQSAWGPIPLGEIGSISLRLIQRIGKPSHPKYKACRFDITCRNAWGTHYADDYVSSEEENEDNNSNNKQEKTSTPRSSRVYSLMADSPQIAVAWVTMLDSLLVRSANSPRPDIAPSGGATNSGSGGSKRGPTATSKVMTRRRSSTLDMENTVIVRAGESVPHGVKLAINYIFDSTPGIETEQFYVPEPDPSAFKNGLRFLNQFSADPTRTSTRSQLDSYLDPVIAGGVVKLWLKQMEHPIIPFEMYDDFHALSADAKTAPFELHRNLKALVAALPRRNFAMLACLLFHLNDVNEYASKNGMDAERLTLIFTDYIMRPRQPTDNENERDSARLVVKIMIEHVDAIIDEKEADIMKHE